MNFVISACYFLLYRFHMAYHLFLTSVQASSRMRPWKSAVWTSSNPLSLKQLRSRWTHHNQLWPKRYQCSSHIMSTHSWCTVMNCSVCSHLWSNGFPATTKILMLQHNWSRCWYNCCGTPRSWHSVNFTQLWSVHYRSLLGMWQWL